MGDRKEAASKLTLRVDVFRKRMGRVAVKAPGGPAVVLAEPEIRHKWLCSGNFPVRGLEEEGN